MGRDCACGDRSLVLSEVVGRVRRGVRKVMIGVFDQGPPEKYRAYPPALSTGRMEDEVPGGEGCPQYMSVLQWLMLRSVCPMGWKQNHGVLEFGLCWCGVTLFWSRLGHCGCR